RYSIQQTFDRSHGHDPLHDFQFGGNWGRATLIPSHSKYPKASNHLGNDPLDLLLIERHASAIPITDQRIGVFSCLTTSRINLPSLVIITVCPLPAPTASTAICGSPSAPRPS